ncbi:MAG: hypothetical protein ACOX1X_02515 [Dethiobacteria bacterium]|jgi:hypothetical protein
MAIVGVLLLGALIVAYEAPTLCRQERYRDLVVFLIYTVLGLTLSILLLLNIPIGSPNKIIESVAGFLWKMFKKIAAYFVR